MLKKLYKLLLAIVFTMASIPVSVIHAEQIDISEMLPYRFIFLSGPGANGYDAQMPHRTYQGRDAYCVEPGVEFTTADLYNKADFNAYGGLSEYAKETILLASAFGHGYGNRSDMVYYCAAQEIIWDVLGSTTSWEDQDAFVKQAKAEIQADIDLYRSNTNFELFDTVEQKTVMSGQSLDCDIVLNRVYRVRDLNQVISSTSLSKIENLILTDENGNPVSQNQDGIYGNSFYVKSTISKTKGTIVFESAYMNRFQDIPLILYGDGIQNCIATGDILPREHCLHLTPTEVVITPEKYDENHISQKNVKMNLLDSNNQFIDTYDSNQSKTFHLKIGQKYTFDEQDVPDGYYCKKFTFTAHENIDQKPFEMTNDEKIQYQVMKVDEEGNPVKGASLSLYDTTDGTPKLVTMDANPWITDGNPKDISAYLHCGHTYAIVENDVSTRYFLAETQSFTVSKYAPTDNQMIDIRVVDHHITYLIAKVDENNEPVEDAELKIFDVEDYNHEIFHFTSGKEPTKIGNLQRGHTYRLVETMTPDGRYTMEEKLFTVPEYGDEPIVIYGKDETIVYYGMKIDENNHPVKDAVLQLFDITDEEILLQTFTTTEEPTLLGGMIINHTYVLKEIQTPQGYYLSQPVTFTVNQYGTSEPIYVKMVDESIDVKLRKVDSDNHPLADITLELMQADTNEIIGTWQTKPDQDIQVGSLLTMNTTYILRETEVVNGYYKSKDITFTVSDYAPKEPITITMVDEAIEIDVDKVNLDQESLEGIQLQLFDIHQNLLDEWLTDGTPHDISDLVHAGDTYVIHENATIDGYYYAKDLEFTVDEYGEDKQRIHLQMVDYPIAYEIVKVDENNEYVEGVTLKLYDKTADQEIATWVTDDKPKQFGSELHSDHTYVLKEEEWIDGFLQATEMEFTVPHTNTTITILQMVDYHTDISFVKLDNYGRPLADAKMAILDADKQVITTFTSNNELSGVDTDDNGLKIASLLKGGETYYLHEVTAPFGFTRSSDVAFVMEGSTANPQVVVMEDQPEDVYLKIRKSDIADDTNLLKGAVYGLFLNETNEPVKDAYGEQMVLISDENGVDEIVFPYNQDGFYLQELKAPEGYAIDQTQHRVTPTSTSGLTLENPVFLEVKDEEEVKTAASTWRMMIAMMGLLSVGAALMFHANKH